jgi:hypothetical protein
MSIIRQNKKVCANIASSMKLVKNEYTIKRLKVMLDFEAAVL